MERLNKCSLEDCKDDCSPTHLERGEVQRRASIRHSQGRYQVNENPVITTLWLMDENPGDE